MTTTEKNANPTDADLERFAAELMDEIAIGHLTDIQIDGAMRRGMQRKIREFRATGRAGR